VKIVNKKLEDWSASYDGPKFHAVLCDPPYDYAFMGKSWDSGADFKRWGEAILPHLYPGALVLMFGGTRTWHRLACGMEDAGFEIWDTMMWLHGQGFPKAQAIDKLIDGKNGDEREVVGSKIGLPGYSLSPKQSGVSLELSKHRDAEAECRITAPGSEQSAPWQGYKTTALKPAWEPVLCFKKPLIGTYAEMAMQFGSGALNVDGGRVPVTDIDSRDVGRVITRNVRPEDGWGFNADESDQTQVVKANGRYPANLLLDPTSAEILDAQTGDRKAGASVSGCEPSSPTDACYGEYTRVPFNGFGDNGGASRFYYCAKASSAERSVGLDSFKKVAHGQSGGAQQALREGKTEYLQDGHIGLNRIKMTRNPHPTVKPIDLCRYLATLLLPPDSVEPRRLLVPFAGSGSEMIGAMLAGWDEIIGVEQDTEHGYVAIAEARIDWWKWAKENSRLTDPSAILQRFGLGDEPDESQPSLFGGQPEQLAL